VKAGGPAKVYDHATTQALSRMALETYLTYFHVFQQPGDNSTKRDLRYSAWRLASLRAEGDWHTGAGSDLPDKWLATIAAVRSDLQQNPTFEALDNKNRQRILEGRWRRPPWAKIAQEAGLPTTVSGPLYNMLSESMHSGSYAAFKIVQADPAAQKRLVETDLLLVMIIMGKGLHSHLGILELPQDLRKVIEYWSAAWSAEPIPAKESER